MSEDAKHRKLLEILSQVGFDTKYFAFYADHAAQLNGDWSDATKSDFEAALKPTGLDFTYHASDKFFEHLREGKNATTKLKVAFPNSTVEFLMHVKTNKGFTGGPYPRLAREAGQLKDPSFSPSPRAPKLPFSNEAELKEAVRFGVSLFEEASKALDKYDGWNS